MVAHTGSTRRSTKKEWTTEALEHWKAKLAIQGQREARGGLGSGACARRLQKSAGAGGRHSGGTLSTANVSPFDIAVLYADAGDKDQTLDWLEKAESGGAAPEYTPHPCDPEPASLRGEPRFRDLLRRMNLPQE